MSSTCERKLTVSSIFSQGDGGVGVSSALGKYSECSLDMKVKALKAKTAVTRIWRCSQPMAEGGKQKDME